MHTGFCNVVSEQSSNCTNTTVLQGKLEAEIDTAFNLNATD